MFFRHLLVSLTCALYLISNAQQTNFDYFTTNSEGLSQSVVTDIMEDKKGNLWISTEDGLNRFDGDVFKRFYREDGLFGHEIECAVEDNNGRIWVATRRGLNCIYNDHVVPINSELKKYVYNKKISKLFFSKNEHLYVVIGSRELISWNGENVVEHYLPLKSNYIINEIIEYKDSIFIATNFGLAKISSFKPESNFEIENSFSINCMTIFKNQLILGKSNGLISYDKPILNDSCFSFFDSISIHKLCADKDRLIAAEVTEFFHVFKNNSIKTFNRHNGSHTTNINDVFIDREKSIWICYYGDGLSQYREKPFITYTKAFNNFTGGAVHAICVEENEDLWVGGSNGLYFKSKDNRFFKRYYPKRDFVNCKMNSNSIWGVVKDSFGRIWICNPSSNLVIYENNSFRQLYFSEKELLKSGFDKVDAEKVTRAIKEPRTISIDKNNNIWIGSYRSGLVVIDEKLNCLGYFDSQNGLASNTIQSLLIDSDNVIWVGTANGLSKIQNDSVYNFTNFSELKKSVYSLRKDLYGNLLVATDCGLYKLIFENDSVKAINHYDIKNGLASSVVYAMEVDNLGNIYLGTTLGIDKVTETSIQKFNIVEKHYGPSEGFSNVECNTNASFKDLNGDVWFGTISVSKLRLNHDKIDLVPPNLFINDIRFNYNNVEQWELKNGITQSIIDFQDPIFFHHQNHLTFDYKAITNVSPKKIKYSFKLEPSDTVWSPKTKQRFSTYSNLSPGKYTFKVKAENIDKTESEIVTYSFQIAKPWWKESWFYFLEFVFGFIMIYAFVQFRIRRLRKNQILLEEKVDQRTIQLNREKQKVEVQNKEIKKSINYARRIQNSILPEEKLMKQYFNDFMVYYRPKDIVGGDFYWYRCFGNIAVIATVDCTGHGVPGGFMSMMGSLLLDKIIQKNNLNSSKILKELNSEIVRVLDQQSGGEIQDGMDIALCVIDKASNKLVFSGARNGITIVRSDKVEKIDADLFSVGGSYTNRSKNLKRDFKSHEIFLNKEDWVFMYTDGYYDQLGEGDMSSLGLAKFEQILKSLSESKKNSNNSLEKEFEVWKGSIPQIDDVLIIGFKI